MASNKRSDGRTRRKLRIRKKISGTPEKPRLSVFRSLKHIYAQVIDDTTGKTLVSASTLEKDQGKGGRNRATAEVLGKRLAERAKAANIERVVFDRNGYIYHGIVKAFADAAREGGLRF
jgi:large subunit ribosomal protein L18